MKNRKLILYVAGFLGIFAWYLADGGMSEVEIVFDDLLGRERIVKETPEISEGTPENSETLETSEIDDSLVLFKECLDFDPGNKVSGPALALSGSVVLVSSNHRDTYGCASAVLLEGYKGLLQGNLCKDETECGLQAENFLKKLLTQENQEIQGESKKPIELRCSGRGEKALSIIRDDKNACINQVIVEVPEMSCRSWQTGNLSQAMVASGWGVAKSLDFVPFQGFARKRNLGIWGHGGVTLNPDDFLIQEIRKIAGFSRNVIIIKLI